MLNADPVRIPASEQRFDFRDLFVLDLANNHQGSLEHGLRVIREVGAVVRAAGAKATLKFQFRQLETFIHPAHRSGSEHKQVVRFLGTKLSMEDFKVLRAEVRAQGMLTMCTPFDEDSVDVIVEDDYDIIKVASCSAQDWPLLEKIAEAGKPVVFSTGGLLIEQIDALVSFFDHRGVDSAMMHCVAVYPTPDPLFDLDQIDLLRGRYPGKVVGWSTHESPDDYLPVAMAVAKGAEMFERHVGVATEKAPLNAYSSTPEEVAQWIATKQRATVLRGTAPSLPSADEAAALASLKRGVYAHRSLEPGERLERSDVYFAIPFVEGQMESGKFRPGLVVKTTVGADEAILGSSVEEPENPERMIIQKAIHEAKAMLNEARIVLNSEFTTEYSHHHGISNFREVGAIIINCVNRSYCKKLILQFPGQRHPLHFHKLKEETFQVLHGTLDTLVEGHHRRLRAGETLLIQPGVWHAFSTETGVIFEEVSTTHYTNDSFYREKAINRMSLAERKTAVDHWGRFQLYAEGELGARPEAAPASPVEPEDAKD